MSSHIVTLNTQEVRERNKNRNDKPKEIEQRNPFYDQGQSLIRSSLMKLQQEEINTYEFKYFSNKPKKVFSTSFSISLRNDILRFSGEDTLFTPTFLGKRMTEDESSDESSEEGTKIIIEVGSSSDEEEEFAFNETEVDGRPIMEAMDYSSTSGSDEEESEEEGTSESDEETISRTSRKRTLDERVTYPTYDRDSFKFTPIQTSEELYQELTLKDYQLEAINFLFNNYCENRPSCLAHEMGLGKTIISLSTLNIMYKKLGVFGPFLIVVPLITLPNWEREAKKWLPQFKCHTAWGTAVNGTKAKALEDTSKLYSESVSEQTPLLVLTTYEFLKETTVTRKKWACVIFDEAHKLKSQKTQARKNAEKLKKEYFFLLTGTPMQNSPEELWSLLNLLDPRAFPSYKLFEEKYGELETETAITNLKTAIAPYLIRKTKAQVLHAEMPPKEEILIEIELSSIQKSVYRAIVERKVNFFRKQFASKQDLTYIVNSLRYCCNHPCLISGMEEYLRDEQKRDDKGILIYSSSKMVVVHKLLKKFRDANEKTLILSQFLEMLDVLESYLQSEQISYVRIDGSCPSEERQRYIDKFQTDSECRVFLLSTKISQGINLTAANHVIIYDSDFNPFNDSQAAARAHRIGQTKKVFVYRLVTKDSYEKYIISRASKKLGREKLVLAESDKSDEDITAEEMQRMIKYGVYSLFLNKEQNINKDNELMNTDIDKILERSSKIGVEGEEDGSLVDVINRVTGNDKSIEKQTSNEVIKSVYFVPVEEVSDVALDDPNFWDKTFPDYCDIYTLESRLENVKPFEAHEFESYFKKLVHVATESINRRQKVSEETEKLSRVVEEDKRGLPTKNQLHTFLLKLNSQRYNHHYHSLQKDHLDQVQKWIDQLETKTLRNKKVWASSSDNIKKQEKRSSSNVNDHLDSDAEFDGSDSDDGDNTDDEFECDQNELVRESESLHNINIKTAPPKKKQKTTRSNRGIREKSSENESERPHKKPTTHKKELKFEKSQVSNHLPPPTTRQDTMKQQPTTGFWPSHMQNTPLQLFHPVASSSTNPCSALSANNQQPAQIVNAQSPATNQTNRQRRTNKKPTQTQPVPQQASSSNTPTNQTHGYPLLPPTSNQPSIMFGHPNYREQPPSQPLVSLTTLSPEILSRLSQALQTVPKPILQPQSTNSYQKLVAQQQQPTYLKSTTPNPPKNVPTLGQQQMGIPQPTTTKLMDHLAHTQMPPTQKPPQPVASSSTIRANNQQPAQTARLSSVSSSFNHHSTTQSQNQIHNPTPQPFSTDFDLGDRRTNQPTHGRPVPFNYQPPMNQNASYPTTEQSTNLFRDVRQNPASFQQMVQTMNLNTIKALGVQYLRYLSALKSNYWGNDKQQLVSNCINLLTIIKTQCNKIVSQQQQQQQQQNNPYNNPFHTNPFPPQNVNNIPTTTNTSTYQAYYTQSTQRDGTRTMTSTTTTTFQNTPLHNLSMIPNNPNTALQTQHQQHGRVGIEYYRSIISQANNQTAQSSTMTRVQTTSSPINNNTTTLQLPPQPTTSTSSSTVVQPSLVDLNDNTDYINNWFNFEH